MLSKLKISVTILTKNSRLYLPQVLKALTSFEEVIICDTGSSDDTIEIARGFPNVIIYEQPFTGFGPTHNVASSLAQNDWILSIDSDEVVTNELFYEINHLSLTKGCVYSFPRYNEYKGKWIKWCGWYPDRQIRLYNRTETKFTDAQVHESIISNHLKEVKLEGPLRHYSYANAADFLIKMQSYSTLFAHQYQGKKSSSISKAVLHGLFAFFKSYILKKGIVGGAEGLEISIYNANTAFYKYLKLAEMNQQFLLTKSAQAQKCDDVQMKKPVFLKQEETSIQNLQ
jgi:glycosyltransferase involved in cell wall biosynthesis